MAWPHSRLRTYVATSTPVIKADDLNALQDAVIAFVDATWSFKSIYIDGTGGNNVSPAKGRLYVAGGTALNAAGTDFTATLADGTWGTGSTKAAAGTDARGQFQVTCAGVPGADPTFQLTYKDGTWTTTPFPDAFLENATGDAGAKGKTVWITSSSATQFTAQFNHTPVAGAVYLFGFRVIG